MSKNEARFTELEIEEEQRRVDGLAYLRRTYHERRKALVERIAEAQRMLESLDKQWHTLESDESMARQKLDALRKQHRRELHSREIERLQSLQSRIVAIEKKVGKGRTS